MENCKTSEPMAKKSLMNALENLERKANNLRDLANFSDEVVNILNNPRQQSEQTDEGMVKQGCVDRPPVPDLIDLFNEVADKLETATNRIGNNTERIRSIIE